jgi:hypothetical protein
VFVTELSDTIIAYLADRNTYPKPYVWKAKGEDILRKIQRARTVMNQGCIRLNRWSNRNHLSMPHTVFRFSLLKQWVGSSEQRHPRLSSIQPESGSRRELNVKLFLRHYTSSAGCSFALARKQERYSAIALADGQAVIEGLASRAKLPPFPDSPKVIHP